MPGTMPGTYTFMLGSDDGSQLYIDATLVVDNNGVNLDCNAAHQAASSPHVIPHPMTCRACHLESPCWSLITALVTLPLFQTNVTCGRPVVW